MKGEKEPGRVKGILSRWVRPCSPKIQNDGGVGRKPKGEPVKGEEARKNDKGGNRLGRPEEASGNKLAFPLVHYKVHHLVFLRRIC